MGRELAPVGDVQDHLAIAAGGLQGLFRQARVEHAPATMRHRGAAQLAVLGLSVATRVISGTLARAFDKGQSRLAAAAIS